MSANLETAIAGFERAFGPVPKAASRLIRPTLVAPEGKALVWGDWSAIEARVLPWLANSDGSEEVLDVFRTNDRDPDLPDIYKIEAGRILGKKPLEVDKDGRAIGKVAVLALGFGGAFGALSVMGASYGFALSDEVKLHIVKTWRNGNQWAVEFWNELNDAFFRAWNNPETFHAAGRVGFAFSPTYLGGTMFCYLPDGRALTYTRLRREKVKIEDEETGEIDYEWKVRYQSGYERKSLWHGILAENITQATAASLLRALLVRVEKNPDFPAKLVLHVHDEAVTEASEDRVEETKAALKDEMEFCPEWAEGLPLVAEVTSNWYYTKTKG